MKTYAITNGARIKIGKAANVKRRMAELQTASPYPLELVAVFDGDIELAAHRVLTGTFWRMNGEWFEDSPGLRRALYEMGFKTVVEVDKRHLEREMHEAYRRGVDVGWQRGLKHAMEAMSVEFNDLHPEEHW